ncbi:MAG: hypothetical protein JSU72_09270 [Deltaproteobacteria bacterium]|nr:MAG: hypothetical protein JSU72_09270 [Deltaproteobacteria bacterium]
MMWLLWFALAGSVYGSDMDTAQSRLECARENLRISQASEKRIAAELKKLRNSGDTPRDVLKDYETYLDRVRAMVIENQKLVRDLEAAYALRAAPKGPSPCPKELKVEDQEYLKPHEDEDFDELAALDREFEETLAEFDELLLKEMDKIRALSAIRMRDLAEEAAAAARRLREKGVKVNTSSLERTGGSEGRDSEHGESGAEEGHWGQQQGEAGETQAETGQPQGEAGQTEGETGQAKGDPGQTEGETGQAKGDPGQTEGETGSDDSGATSAAASGGDQKGMSGAGGKGVTGKQQRPSRPSGHDDDIVARQLREAAENETDPELKEKLWKEYEDYKRGSSS